MSVFFSAMTLLSVACTKRRACIFLTSEIRATTFAMKTLLFAIAVTAVAVNASAQARGGPQPVQPIQPVKPGLFMVAGAGANSLVRVTPDGVILVDTKLAGEQNYKALVEQIKSATDKPVKFAIVTHHHADHTGNVDRFLAAGVQVIGHENLKKNVAT